MVTARRDGRSDEGGDGCGEGNGVGDDGGDWGGDGDGDGCSAFGVNGDVCGISNMATKSMKTTTTTWHQHENQHDNQHNNQHGKTALRPHAALHP